MSRQLILNLFLFVIAVSLAFIIYFSEEQSTQLERLTDINLDKVTTIKIQHNKSTISINKTTSHYWKITQPVDIAANEFRINSILKLLHAPVHNKYTSAEIDSRKTGLDNPKTTIQFNNQVIAFGITNPATNLRYLKLNNTIYTIEDVYYPLISSHFGTLVSLNLLPPGSKLAKLILKNQTIFKDEKGRWSSNIDISADNVSKTLQHWLHDQAFGVHQYLKRKELGEVFIYVTGLAQPITFQITDIEPWLVIARPDIGLEYHLDIGAYDNLISPTGSNDNIDLKQ
jgi:hypothetical protein